METRGIKAKRTNDKNNVNTNKIPAGYHRSQTANSFSRIGCFFWQRSSRCLKTVTIAWLLGLLCIGCRTTEVQMHPDIAMGHAPTYLAAGDVLKLSFPGAPEFNQSQKIRPDGRINLPLVGEVDAAGSTIRELQARLARLYKSQLENTEVVIALENRTIPVYVCGAVNRPGKVVIDRPVSALEAIMEAGGFSQTTADMSQVHLIRIENGRHTTKILNLKPALSSKLIAAAYVQPYDVIYVPESLF